jgi:hypothetical protein
MPADVPLRCAVSVLVVEMLVFPDLVVLALALILVVLVKSVWRQMAKLAWRSGSVEHRGALNLDRAIARL